MIGLLDVYLGVSITTFLVTVFNRYHLYDNYFAFGLSYWADPLTNILLYNSWLALMILFQKVAVKMVFHEMKENEKTVSIMLTQKILEKLKLKSLQILFMAVVLHDQFTFPVYALTLSLVVSFVLHHQTVLRSEYLINTHNLYLGQHIRLLSFYLALMFVNFEVLKHSWKWIVAQNNMSIIFTFYTLQLLLLLLEPFVKFSIYLYERFTGYQFHELDSKLNVIGFAINLPRLIVLNFLGFWIMFKFRFSFFFVFMIIELIVELLQLLKSFSKIRGLSKMMDSLPRISRGEIESKKLDDTCTVCFREIYEGILVPSCNHIFHTECLKQWIHKNTNHFCPKCKKPFNFPKNEVPQNNDQAVQPQQQAQQLQQPQPRPNRVFNQGNLNGLADPNRNTDKKAESYQERDLSYEEQAQIQEEFAQYERQSKGIRKSRSSGDDSGPKIINRHLGSFPSCLPTEAVYFRDEYDTQVRRSIYKIHRSIQQVLRHDDPTQMLLVPND